MQGFSLEQNAHLAQSTQPASLAAASTNNGDVISMAKHERIDWLVSLGATDATAADGLITVEACDDFVPTLVTAIPFRLQKREGGGLDVGDAGAKILAAGYTVPNTANIWYVVSVLARDLPEDRPNVRLVLLAASGGTVTEGHVQAVLTGGDVREAASATVLA